MASPIGHTLAGVAAGLAVQRPDKPQLKNWLTVVIIGSNLADIDFLFGLFGESMNQYHRFWTHSLGFVALTVLLAVAVGHWVKRPMTRRTIVLLALVMGSHLLVDMFSLDRKAPLGIPLFWPLWEGYVIAPIMPLGDLVKSGEMRHFFQSLFCVHNLRTVFKEVWLLGPVALVAVYWNHIKKWVKHA